MPDRENVIKEFEHLLNAAKGNYQDFVDLTVDGGEEILALLKEQKAVEPMLEQDSMVCGVCGHEIIWQKMLGDGIWADEKLDYCPHCGREVKWNE